MADLRLCLLLAAARVRSDWQYRASFFTYLVAQVLVTALEFAAIVLLLELVPDLGGWSAVEIAFLYGLASVPFGIATALVVAIDRLPVYVQAGTFDRLLLRPVPAMLQLMALEFEPRRIGKLVPSVAVLLWAAPRVGVDWTVGRIAALLMALVVGSVIYSALWILGAALSFWLVASQEATNSMTYGGEFANHYPLHLYRGWIRAVIGWAIPLAFVAYVPALYLIDSANPLRLPTWLFFASPLVAGATLAVSIGVWNLGTRHYQSTGS